MFDFRSARIRVVIFDHDLPHFARQFGQTAIKTILATLVGVFVRFLRVNRENFGRRVFEGDSLTLFKFF